ncbi:hypothetical protein AVEN_131545-1 [Araneus ventricosus]|uniref:Uncharacterized protein n=1 Tax=Araneus ventricosus TaxID=182803 RepID=A0A4Y2W462_ARAVE|nr:hypothetical protein AVEN_131545-1 [Araneus ventricosus]
MDPHSMGPSEEIIEKIAAECLSRGPLQNGLVPLKEAPQREMKVEITSRVCMAAGFLPNDSSHLLVPLEGNNGLKITARCAGVGVSTKAIPLIGGPQRNRDHAGEVGRKASNPGLTSHLVPQKK